MDDNFISFFGNSAKTAGQQQLVLLQFSSSVSPYVRYFTSICHRRDLCQA